MNRQTRTAVRAAGALVVVLGAVTSMAACTTSGSGSADTGFVSPDKTIRLLSVGERTQPIALAGKTLTGDSLDIASLRGKVVVLNVWGSWCTPCREEAPALQAAYSQLAPQGVAFLGIDTQDPDPAPAIAFAKAVGITYPSLYDDGGRLLLSLRGAVPPKGIPTTLVLDAQGRVAARITSTTTKATLVGIVQDVISGTTGAGSGSSSTAPSPSGAASAGAASAGATASASTS